MGKPSLSTPLGIEIAGNPTTFACTVNKSDNKKLTDSIFILMDQLTKLISQQILIMQNQNELFKDFIKIKKAG